MRRATTIVAALTCGACGAAFADHRYDSAGSWERQQFDGEYDYARVLHVEPVVRYVRVQTPRQRCYDHVEYYADDHRRRPRGTAGASIAGGLIGGLIGRQFGSGDGRDAATLVGTLVGSSIGHDRAHRSARYGRSRARGYPVERCEVIYETHEEERIDGYRVTYEYEGREYTTHTQRHPGKEIRVRVAVTPVES
ncbi:hypothetical protein BH24PSE2_BH24PSE2_10440 [soil metagenome]